MGVGRWDQVRLSICIQHVSSRDDDPVFQRLLKDLATYSPRVVTADPQRAAWNLTWQTYARCLAATPATATHRLILQDDVEVCRDFIDGVKLAVKARPDRLLSFFISQMPAVQAASARAAAEDCVSWAALDARTWIPTQALCWPVFLIPPALRFSEHHNGFEGVPDDQVVGRFCTTYGQIALQSVPTLVEHVHAESTTLPKTSVGGAYRRAILHINGCHADYSARDVDWSSGVR